MSLISGDSTFAILTVFFGLTVLGLWVEGTNFGKRLSGVMIVIIATAVLANINVLPREAPVYGLIWTYMVPLAIALFLLKADLVRG